MKFLVTLSFFFFIHSANSATTILFLGDSLTEGLGVDEEQAFPRVLEKKLNSDSYDVKIINGGVSGATSASGLSRLKWHLKKKTDVVVLELGANDGLRGLKIADTQKNLGEIIKLAQERKVKILLLGLMMPPNYGKKYTDDFKGMYVTLANTYKIPTLPSFLKGVEGVAAFNQADGIHPNIKGHVAIADNVYAFLSNELTKIGKKTK